MAPRFDGSQNVCYTLSDVESEGAGTAADALGPWPRGQRTVQPLNAPAPTGPGPISLGGDTMKPVRRFAAWFAVAAAAIALAAPAAHATLVHQYTFDADNVHDSAGGLNGTIFGALVFDGSDTKQGAKAAVFSGNEYVDFASSAFSASQFTVTLWVKPATSSLSFAETFIANKGGGGVDGFALWWLGGNVPAYGSAYVEASNGTTSNSAISTAGVVTTGVWQHLAFAVDRTVGTATIYLNAVNVTSDSVILTDFNVDGAWRMGLFTDGQYPLHAVLDDVRIYDEILRAGDIALIMNYPDAVIPEPVTLVSSAFLFGLAWLSARRRAA